MYRTFFRLASSIVVVTGAVAIAACAPGGSAPAPEPTNPPPPVYSGEPLPDIDVAEVDVADDIDVAEASEAWRFDDVIVVRGGDSEGYTAAAAIDTETGERLWHTSDEGFDRIEAPDDRTTLFSPGHDLVGVPEHDLVVAETYTRPCPGDPDLCDGSEPETTKGFGLAALDARDTSVVWTNELLPPIDRTEAVGTNRDDVSLTITAHSSDVLIVSVAPYDALSAEDPSGLTFEAVGLDAATGEELWTIPQATSRVVTDDYLLTSVFEEGADPLLEIRDPRTGDVLRAADGVDGRWIAAAGDLGLVAVDHPETGTRTAAVLVDLSSGAPIGEPLSAWSEQGPALVSFDDVLLGVEDGREYAAWPSGAGYVADTGESRWVLNSRWADETERTEGKTRLDAQPFAERTADGYVWVKTAQDGADGYEIAAYDRTGEARSERIPVRSGVVHDGVITEHEILGGDQGRNIRVWTYDLP